MEKKTKENGKLKKGLGEFKQFITRGNVVDLAVGVIIGGAFGKIVTSLVNDIIMPIIGVILGGLKFSELSITVGSADIKYGLFIQNIVDFLIIAFCIFMFIKIINTFSNKNKKEEVKAKEEIKAPIVNEEVKLLGEIRDLLKNKR